MLGDTAPAAAIGVDGLELVDLFGDGLPSLLQLDGAGRYWRNRGGGGFDPPRSFAEAPAGVVLGAPGVLLTDLDGDGRAELVVTGDGYATVWTMCRTPRDDARAGFETGPVVTSAPSFPMTDGRTRLIDLDGDHRLDVLRAARPAVFAIGDGSGGFGDLRPLPRGGGAPPVDLDDERVRIADMTGDGLADIVEISTGSIRYHPNLGHGRFGPEVRMTAAPRYPDAGRFGPHGFDPGRLLLGDVTGDGTADVVYVGDGATTVWLNRCGNGFAAPVTIRGTPPYDSGTGVRLADLNGTGVSGVLWTGIGTHARSAFLDLTGGVKPYLLTGVDNHRGATTTVTWSTSTAFATADRTAGRPWSTTLPFPVHVVTATATRDRFSGTTLTTRYAYHDGFWDPVDREFRGFGSVEHIDAEHADPGLPAPARVEPLDPLTPPSAVPAGLDPARSGNLLGNGSFDVPCPGVSSSALTTTAAAPSGGGPSAAGDWTVWNNAPATTTTDLVPSTLPQGRGGSMIRVRTDAAGCGLVQTFGAGGAGPARAATSVWVYVVRGSVLLGTGDSGGTGADVRCAATGRWTLMSTGNGSTPTNEVIIFAASAGGAEFYVDHAWTTAARPATGGIPVRTRTWFHQGPVGPDPARWCGAASPAGSWPDDPPLAAPADLSALPADLPGMVLREAVRALRGRVLRAEVYAEDGTARAGRPYQVADHHLRVVPVLDGRTAADPSWRAAPVFAVHEVVSRDTWWDRGIDPMTRVTAHGDFDEYGRAGFAVEAGVPRGRDPRGPGEPCLAIVTTTAYATRADAGVYLIDRVARVARHRAADAGDGTVLDFVRGATPAELLGLSLTYYDGPAFEGLPTGRLGDHGLPVRTEHLALTPERLARICGPDAVPAYLRPEGEPGEPDPWPVVVETGYVWRAEGEPGHYAQTSRLSYDVHDPRPGRVARGLVLISRDATGGDTTTSYDDYDLRAAVVTDPAGLSTTIGYDPRTLQPSLVTDANGNRVRTAYTPLGMPAWQARLGRAGDGRGDTEEQPGVHFRYDLAGGDPDRPISVTTVRRVDHRWTLVDAENARRATAGEPPLTGAGIDAMFGPEEESAHPERFTRVVEYSDGFGRPLQTRTLTDEHTLTCLGLGDAPGEAGREITVTAPGPEPGVVVSGWQSYDHKGNPVRTFEPFFDTGFAYRPPQREVSSVARRYDPRGRLVATVAADGSETTVVFGVPADVAKPDDADPTPWETYTYDANDNAGRTHPTTTLPMAGHWNTPSSTLADALGRTVRTTQRGPDGPVVAAHEYDLDGNLLTATDPLGRRAAATTYDLLGRPWLTWYFDGGTTRTFRDAAGSIVEQRDAVARSLHVVDASHRPVATWVSEDDGPPTLRCVVVYGDDAVRSGLTRERAAAAHVLGRVVTTFDEAGRVTVEGYDTEGNATATTRHHLRPDLLLGTLGAASYAVDWRPVAGASPATLLAPTPYRVDERYDALGRRTSVTAPADATGARVVLSYAYGRGGGIARVVLDGTVHLRAAGYDAQGRRILAHLGNGVLIRTHYDPRSTRLRRLRAEHAEGDAGTGWTCDGPVLQDLTYRYDPVGNPLTVAERTLRCGVAPGDPDALDRQFGYDELGRLVSATGRETGAVPERPWLDGGHATDWTLARPYTETYRYDGAGNLDRIRHQGDVTYARTMTFDAGDNRLATVETGALTFGYEHDARGGTTVEAGNRRYGWDHAGRLATFRVQAGDAEPTMVAHYRYDAGGRRVMKVVRPANGSWRYVVSVGGFERVIIVSSAGAESVHDTVHAGLGAARLATVVRGTPLPGDPFGDHPVTYPLADHLTSACATLDGGGAVLNREEYLPFGETSLGSYANKRYRFSARERDEESSLAYHGARYYAPWLGRWTAPDPHGFADGMCRYAYARNNPLRWTDAAGTQAQQPNAVTADTAGTVKSGFFKQATNSYLGELAAWADDEASRWRWVARLTGWKWARDYVAKREAEADAFRAEMETMTNTDEKIGSWLFIGYETAAESIKDGLQQRAFQKGAAVGARRQAPVKAATPAQPAEVDPVPAAPAASPAPKPAAPTPEPEQPTFVIGPSKTKAPAPAPTVTPIAPGETPMEYGTKTHQSLPAVVKQTNPTAVGTFNVAPGLTGADFEPHSGANFTYGEMKSLWGRQSPMLRQGRNWGFDPQTGRYFFYDRGTGYVGEGIIQTEKYGRSGSFR